MILGVDVSYWQQTVDWALLKSVGVEYAFIKATQGNYMTDSMMLKHLEGAQKAGLITGLYHWCDPTVGDEAQAQYFVQQTKGLSYSFAVADMEQHWADWNEWRQGKVTKILSPDRINKNGQTILNYWNQNLKVRTVLYTRGSFVREYAKSAAWVCGYPLWLAHYPYASGRIKTTWEVFKTQYKPGISAPFLPPGCSSWTFWQFTGDKFILPGISTAADVNYFNGSLDDLRTFANLPPVEPPPPTLTLEERVRRLEEEARKRGWNI